MNNLVFTQAELKLIKSVLNKAVCDLIIIANVHEKYGINELAQSCENTIKHILTIMNNLVFTQAELKLIKNVVGGEYEQLIEKGEKCFDNEDYISSSSYLKDADALLTILCKLTTYLKQTNDVPRETKI